MGIKGIVLVLLVIIVIIFSISNLQNITLVFFGVKTISFPLSFAILFFVLMGFLSSLTIQFLNQIFKPQSVTKYPEESQYSASPPPSPPPPVNPPYNNDDDDYDDNFSQRRSQSKPLKQSNLNNNNPVDFPQYSDNLNEPEIEDNFSYQETAKYYYEKEQKETENVSSQPNYSTPEISSNQEAITSKPENINKTNDNLEQEKLEIENSEVSRENNREKESTTLPMKPREASPYSFTPKEKTFIKTSSSHPTNVGEKKRPASSDKDDVYTASYRIIKNDSPRVDSPEFDDDEDWDF